MDIMFISDFLTSLSCTSNECMSWIIIALNILTVSHLVFCSFFKFTKTLKVLGFIWLFLALAGIVAVIVYHTCIFTIICALFTILILITTFAVILTNSDDSHKKKKNNYGSYVINPTTDGKYTFSFYDKKKHLVLQSGYYLKSLEEIGSAINVCRKRGNIAQFEDHTKTKFLDNGFPKFELHTDGQHYFYLFRCNSKTLVFKSKLYCKYKKCLKDVKKMAKVIKSSRVYYSSEIVESEGLSELKSKYIKSIDIA